MKKIRIGIVGCGAIGSSLARIVAKEFKNKAVLSGLFDIDINKSRCLSYKICRSGRLAARTLNQLIGKCDMVVESASAKSSWNIAQTVLKRGRNIMIMSVGGILEHTDSLSRLASKCNAKVYIPSGAISGVDALKAAKVGSIKKVTLTTYKNPRSFKGVNYVERMGIDLNKIKKDKILFSGRALQAVKFFPQNINVAAVLSIAGIGQAKTVVRIVASPKTKNNIHEIEIESSAGKVYTRTENIVHPDNPKTSYLAVLAAAATLKQILDPIKIGN